MVLSRAAFRRLVEESLRSLPSAFRRKLENVEIVVEDWPTPEDLRRAGVEPGGTLLGLYTGVPLLQRGTWYGGVLPDRITLFRRSLQALCQTRRELKRQIQITLMHEIGHHFGLGEEELEEVEG